MPPKPHKALLTPDEVAQMLRVTRRTVYTWLRSGKMKSVKVGGVWRIKPGEIHGER